MDVGRDPVDEDEFARIWGLIEEEMGKLGTGMNCNAIEVYNWVYVVCTSCTMRFESKLYWKIGDFMYMKAREMRAEIFGRENWVQGYNEKFRQFREIICAIDEMCDFLNECVRERTIRDLGFLLWERCILQQTMKYKHTTLGAELVNRCKAEEVREAIESMRLIVPDQKQPLLYYTQRYEQYAIQRIRSKYEEEAKQQDMDAERYSFYVNEKICHERSMRDKIFLEESWPKVESVLEDVFLMNKKERLFEEVYGILCQYRLPVEKITRMVNEGTDRNGSGASGSCENDFYELHGTSPCAGEGSMRFARDVFLERMSVVYENLSGLKSAYAVLKDVLVRYVREKCEENASGYGAGVEPLYTFYCMLRHVVGVGYLEDKECLQVLKRELSAACSKLRPSLEARLLDFCDSMVEDPQSVFVFLNKRSAVMHREAEGGANDSKAMIGARMDTYSKAVFVRRVFGTLFKMVDGKQGFYEMYLDRLGKRLLNGKPNPEEERKLVQLMRRKGNHDFVRKAEAMIGDVVISMSYNKDAEKFVWVLTQAYWPSNEDVEVEIPYELEMIRRVYDGKFERKRLQWAWQLGKVVVEAMGREVEMSILQYAVFDLFNRYEKIDAELARKETRLSSKAVKSVMVSLMKGGLVLSMDGEYMLGSSEDIGIRSICGLYCNEADEPDHEIDMHVYYQSLISKILKASKQMGIASLVEEAKKLHTECIEYDPAAFEEGIRTLDEKGILERNGEVCVYVP
ncbi:cullin [Ordospora pajunii]|uniref:cullin n=1 Tax=Ordospora pajunii TaxID=3039483 RepID=UPI00295278E5|nr:cullin [Ordospora pajunii]KAH9411134.1 cullin [Ordospora pajunii]